MTTTTIDKAAWARGEWDHECDRDSWTDEATGFACIIKRHPHSGHWCGYVGVPAGHPWNGKAYDDVGADVHGGLTYAQACDGDAVNGVCHVPREGEADGVWWLGFDCLHYRDESPAQIGRYGRDYEATYRNEYYVRREVASLAMQAKEAAR